MHSQLSPQCSTQPRVWAAGQMSCGVQVRLSLAVWNRDLKVPQNPTLSGLFPGQSTLNILRTLNPSNTLAPNLSSFGPAGYLLVILWYDGEEQFVCQAKNCKQTTTDTSANWSCDSLECQCRPGAAFCGKDPVSAPPTVILLASPKATLTNLGQLRNLTDIINKLGGTVEINCSTSGGTTSCQFLQDTIRSVFGNGGLQMNGCTSGECVRQNVIDSFFFNGTNSTNSTNSTNTSNEGTHVPGLSGGVIAGLAVVGGLVLIGFLLLLWGFIVQRRARQDTTVAPRTGGVTVEWKNIDYSIAATHSAFFGQTRSSTGNGKVILQNLSGVVRPGETLAVLGPSGWRGPLCS